MNKLILTLGAFLALTASAAEQGKIPATKIPMPRSFADVLEQIAVDHDKNGMLLVKEGTAKGEITFVNAQTKLSEADVQQLTKHLAYRTRFNFGYVKSEAPKGCPCELKDKAKGAFAVIVVEDEKTPAVLVAPEDRWAVVNVGKLGKELEGAKDPERTFRKRCVKEMARAFSMLCGGATSQFPGNVMDVTSIKSLDTTEGLLPVDLQKKYAVYLKACGLQPRECVPYFKACQEGWAPKPTNELQKKIWEQVYTMPDKPIKIEKKKADKK